MYIIQYKGKIEKKKRNDKARAGTNNHAPSQRSKRKIKHIKQNKQIKKINKQLIKKESNNNPLFPIQARSETSWPVVKTPSFEPMIYVDGALVTGQQTGFEL